MKRLLPSLKEKTRYIVFQIISEKKMNFLIIEKVIKEAILSFIGQLGVSKANPIILKDCWNQEKQKGVIKINHKFIDEIKMSLALIKNINNTKAIVDCIGVSGILNKAKKKYMEV